MGRPREHTAETREHLLRVAGRIIRTSGPGALTVRGLAAEAGVTTRAIYSLFSGLPELIGVLCERSSEAMIRHHESVPVTDDPIGEILPLALAYRAAAQEQADLYGMLYGPVPAGPSASGSAGGSSPSEYPEWASRTVGRVEDTIQRALDAGQLRSVDPLVLMRGMWALVHGLTSLELRGLLGTPEECDRIWHDAITTYVHGLSGELSSAHRDQF